jgi:hypothetical protein
MELWNSMQRSGRIARRCAAAVLTASLLPGCALFPAFWLPDIGEVAQKHLPPVAPSQDAIGVELFFVERPPGDLLMGDALWDELDQIATVSPECREALRQNGIRFGLAGVNVPYALSSLMSADGRNEPGMRTLRQPYQIPSGVKQQIPCAAIPDGAEIVIQDSGNSRTQTFQNGRAVIRCRIERTQEGWARVEIVPEIHHGLHRMRPQPNDQSWDWNGGQEVESLYGQRFSVDLNEGECLVLGAVGEQGDSVGARFFRPVEEDQPFQKLLIIRLNSIDRVAAVRQQ